MSYFIHAHPTTQQSTVEEGLKQMSSVQDNVIKKMEQNVDS